MTSTPPRPCPAPISAAAAAEHLAAADQFLALVEQTRTAVQAALTVDAAARARRAAPQPAGSGDDGEEATGTDDARVPPTQLEQVVNALLSGGNATLAAIRVIGSAAAEDPSDG